MISLEFDGVKTPDRRSICAAVEASMPFLRQRASRFSSWNAAVDQDDFIQEAAIGFLCALSSYDPEKAVPFGLYASRCVDNRLKSFSLSQRRKKRFPVGGVVSLNDEGMDPAFLSPCGEADLNPEELVILRERFESLMERINLTLSHFEWEVLSLYLYGCGMTEVSSQLQATPKQVDNAMQRVRRKCKVLLSE